jgi:S-DNA-T family DNA segregation ATPase FtsK/SpoIIIE
LRHGLFEGTVIFLIAVSLYLMLALVTYAPSDPGWTHAGGAGQVANAGGVAGAWCADILLALFGFLAYLFPLLVGFWALKALRERYAGLSLSWAMIALRGVGFALTLLAGTGLSSIYITGGSPLPEQAGGILGHSIASISLATFNQLGGSLLLSALFLVGVTVFTGLSWIALLGAIARGVHKSWFASVNGWKNWREKRADKKVAQVVVQKRKQQVEEARRKQQTRIPPTIKTAVKQVESSVRVDRERQQPLFREPVTGELPPLSLLDPVDDNHSGGYSSETLDAMSRMLEIKLKDFSIEAEVVAVQPGPVITRFEIQPAPGIKVSRITNLAKDLARSLAVISVRVVEVIPGKTTIGIEIPNERREMIRLTEVISSRVFDEAASAVTLSLGKDISGQPVVADLAKMPHLLVAGTTGSGKSVGINAMLLSILFKSTPEQVRLIMIDPKMLELAVYDGIPHLLTPVVTDMKQAASALRWGVAEMERRYRRMAACGVRNLAGYNRKILDAEKKGTPLKDPLWKPQDPMNLEEEAPLAQKLPIIVIVIDEFADMMMIVGKKVEELIARIAQKARAAGIHLILATQRPSVDVITGLIKANVPSRISFQVSSKVDARTVLDQGGAEQLLGQGDMLYLPGGTSVPERVHGAFVSDDEVHRVCSDWRARGEPDYLEEILQSGMDDTASEGSFETDDEADPLYDEALAYVTESRRASISSVQRKLKIGYNRAARLIETMEAAGVVSEAGHNGQREVLAPPPVE